MIDHLVGITVKKFGNPFPGWKGWRAAYNKAKKAAYLAMGKEWHLKIRPRHFTADAKRRYGYAPREGEPGNQNAHGFWKSYTGRKRKYHHHGRPLEWAGQSKRATRLARVTSTSRGVRIAGSLGGLGRRPHPKSPDMEAELLTVDQQDADQMAKVFAKSTDQQISRMHTNQTQVLA